MEAAMVEVDPSFHWGQYCEMCPCLLHRKHHPSDRCFSFSPVTPVVVAQALVLPMSIAFGLRLSTFLHCVCVCP